MTTKRTIFRWIASVSVMIWAAAAAVATEPSALQLADIAPANGPQLSSDGYGLTVFDGIAYFTATDEATGGELWRSDGTAAGTWRVADICPGTCDAGFWRIVIYDGALYFVAYRPANGYELWTSDGTTAGTRLAVEVLPGPEDGVLELVAPSPAGLFFLGHDGETGRELWISDGTPGGTLLLADIRPGFEGLPDFSSNNVAWVGGRLFFSADDGAHGRELWSSDGTPSGTALVADAVGGATGLEPDFLTPIGSSVVFRGYDPASGGELWISDGTAGGTTLLKDIWPGSAGSWPQSLTSSGGVVYLAAASGSSNWGLWKTDGTADGTVLVRSMFPGDLVDWNGTLYFYGSSPSGLWKSDGTAGGTQFVGGSNNVQEITPAGGRLYFRSDGGGPPWLGFELWTSDGTGGGTYRVLDLRPGQGGSYPTDFLDFGAGVALFFADDGSYGKELWRTQGSAPTTERVADIGGSATGSLPQPFVADSARAFFAAGPMYATPDASWRDRELWMSDGTPAGTQLVLDIAPGTTGSSPSGLGVGLGGVLFFADDGVHGNELWKSDGSAAGTTQIADICPGGCGGGSYADPEPPIELDGAFYFAGASDGTDFELWRSDGTEAGTVQVADLSPSDYGSEPRDLTVAGGLLYFAASDDAFFYPLGRGVAWFTPEPWTPVRDVELWTYDGATASRVADLRPGAAGSHPAELTPFGSAILFRASDGASGRELWRSEGSIATTQLVKDIALGGAASGPAGFVVLPGPVALFAATDSTAGRELWRTDGTGAGTWRVADLAPGAASSDPRGLTRSGDVVYFMADDGASGPELWASDGTAPGTWRVADLWPGAAGSDPRDLTIDGEALLFSADDGTHGVEVWASDGIQVALVADLASGGDSSRPEAMCSLPAGPGVMGAAADGVSGLEPWLFALPDLAVSLVASPVPVLEEEPLTYTVGVTHAGGATALAPNLVLALPAEVTFVASSPPEPDCVYEALPHSVSCTLAPLDPGAATSASVETIVAAGAAPSVSATATVSVSGQIDRRRSDNSIVTSTSVRSHSIFADGFETGDTSRWSQVAP